MVLYLVFHPLGLGLDKVLFDWNSVNPGSSPEDCYQLRKGIYGLCQAATQFWKKFVDTIKKESFGFLVSPADPCMLFKENELGICIIIMYVDDMLIIGKKVQIQDFPSKIQKGLFSKNTTQPCRLPWLRIPHEQGKNKRMAWTTLNYQKPRTQVWRESYKRKAISDTRHTQIYSQKEENPEDKVNQEDHETYRS